MNKSLDSVVGVEALIRISVIEKILIKSQITTKEELVREMNELFDVVVKELLIKANVKGDLDEIIRSLKESTK